MELDGKVIEIARQYFAGIHRDVWLCRRPQAHIEDVTITTDIDGNDGIVTWSVLLHDAEPLTTRVTIFDTEGNVAGSWGDNTTVPGSIHGCFVDKDKNVFVAGNSDAVVQKYSPDGKLLLQIGTRGKFDSVDGTRRYLLRLHDGKTVESVWMPEGERATICISSQVGCPVDCRFCLTALLGLERSLTAGEIVGQVLRVCADQGVEPHVDRLNIVMMGQGEPLLNLPNVLKATRLMADQRGGAISTRRITVSTSGIIPKIVELGQAEIRPRLAISLNASVS